MDGDGQGIGLLLPPVCLLRGGHVDGVLLRDFSYTDGERWMQARAGLRCWDRECNSASGRHVHPIQACRRLPWLRCVTALFNSVRGGSEHVIVMRALSETCNGGLRWIGYSNVRFRRLHHISKKTSTDNEALISDLLFNVFLVFLSFET